MCAVRVGTFVGMLFVHITGIFGHMNLPILHAAYKSKV